MTETLAGIRAHLDQALIEDHENGVYRAKRSIFTDEELFDLEMKHIFEGNWVYLAHDSQIPNVGDYFTTHIGRQPIIISRDKQGGLNALINACSHRGAMLCRRKTDNRTTFTCPFHGWTFNNTGKLLKVKDPREAGYPEQFNKEGSHDLTKVARFESYRGFLFGSINPDVKPLEEHLGESTKIIDMIVDQSPEGLEVLRGTSTTPTTATGSCRRRTAPTAITSRRCTGTMRPLRPAAPPASRQRNQEHGRRRLGQAKGRLLLLRPRPPAALDRMAGPQQPAAFRPARRTREKYGEAKADWMINISRNLCLYPNVYLMDQFGSQIRHFRPISVDKTEVTIYCIAPKGESAEARANRIRQYEDFFNASGMATPDDLEEFRSCQQTYLATAAPGTTSAAVSPIRSRPGRQCGQDRTQTDFQRRPDRRRGPVPHPARLLGGDDAQGGRRRRSSIAAQN